MDLRPVRDEGELCIQGEAPAIADHLGQEDGRLYCLSCRREMAGEAGLEGVDEDTPNQERQQIRSHARIEFEIKRDPERADNEIAKACRTSTFAVRKARARGLDGAGTTALKATSRGSGPGTLLP